MAMDRWEVAGLARKRRERKKKKEREKERETEREREREREKKRIKVTELLLKVLFLVGLVGCFLR